MTGWASLGGDAMKAVTWWTDGEIAVAAAPHTGSTSVGQVCADHGWEHQTYTPKHRTNRLTFCTVRDPHDRWLSAVAHYIEHRQLPIGDIVAGLRITQTSFVPANLMSQTWFYAGVTHQAFVRPATLRVVFGSMPHRNEHESGDAAMEVWSRLGGLDRMLWRRIFDDDLHIAAKTLGPSEVKVRLEAEGWL